MKTLVRIFCVLWLVLIVIAQPAIADEENNFQALPETSIIKQDLQKIDLNNANIYNFRKVRGMYPTLGRIIIEHAPYASLEDVLSIPGLTETQKRTILDNADQFALFKPDNSMNRERINNANYRL